jgi:hypothetical protein
MKIHYDGWLKLSPALLRSLGAKSGDMLEAELRDGVLVLRPINGKARVVASDAAVPSPTEPMANEGRAPRRRSSDKVAGSPSSAVLSSGRRAGGRKPRGSSAG